MGTTSQKLRHVPLIQLIAYVQCILTLPRSCSSEKLERVVARIPSVDLVIVPLFCFHYVALSVPLSTETWISLYYLYSVAIAMGPHIL